MKITLTDYLRRRVHRGAMYLDLTNVGWWEKINTNFLDIKNGCNCIIGQLYPSISFSISMCDLNLDSRDFGFNAFSPNLHHLAHIVPTKKQRGLSVYTMQRFITNKQYDILQTLWLEEIHIRKNNKINLHYLTRHEKRRLELQPSILMD